MSSEKVIAVEWYADKSATAKQEPGLAHSFIRSLATAINHLEGELDPVWLMGSSAFAFRIWIAENLCPSAMSVFDWSAILPEAAAQYGYENSHICRFWGESEVEAERQKQAHQAILESIDSGRPAIAWDVAVPEWGLVIGYDEAQESYQILSHKGEKASLPFAKLGRNGIDILSVLTLGVKGERAHEEVVRSSLKTAVRHAHQQEWMERPQYQDGLSAFDLWALIMERGAMLAEAGKIEKIGAEIPRFAAYYAEHHCAARCYARDYLSQIADGSDLLEEAAGHYSEVAAALAPVWRFFSAEEPWTAASLLEQSRLIKQAGEAEAKAISLLERYLAE